MQRKAISATRGHHRGHYISGIDLPVDGGLVAV